MPDESTIFTTAAEREAYADVLLAFQDWCGRRGLNFRAEMTRLIRGRLGEAGDAMPCANSIDQPASRTTGRTLDEQRAYSRAYYLANKERIKAYQRDYMRRRRAAERGQGVSHG